MKLGHGAFLVLSKEIRETLRDRNLLVNLVFVPLFLYPTLGFGAFQVLQIVRGVSERAKPEVHVSPDAPVALRDSLFARDEIVVVLDGPRAEALRAAGDSAAVRAAWKSSFPEPAAVLDWSASGTDSAIIYHDGSRDRSRVARGVLEEEVHDWKRAAISERALTRGLQPTDIASWDVEEEDTASASERGQEILSTVLPITLLLMLLIGTYYSALDTIVGERERGTLETLLVSPLERGEILLGKFLYVVLASLTSLVLNLASLTLFLGLLLAQLPSKSEIRVALDPKAIVFILVGAGLAAAFFAAVLMLACVSSKTYREGQAALLPYYFGSILLGMSTSASRDAFTTREALIPVVNVVALFKSVLRGEYPPDAIGTAFASLAALAGLALFVAARAGLREDVTWGAKPKLAQLFFPAKEPRS